MEAPLESEGMRIPVQFTEPESTLMPMNVVESMIVQELRQIRKTTRHKECRICLESEEETSKIITPCRCTGSIEYAHEHCMVEWIKRRLSIDSKKKASCEVCSTDFRFKAANSRHFDCDELSKHYQKQRKELLIFFLVYGSFFLLFFVLTALVIVATEDSTFFMHSFVSQSAGVTICVSVLVIFGLALLVVGVLFVSEYLVREEVVISRVLNFEELKQARNYKIYFRK
jgi:hypothetical protein